MRRVLFSTPHVIQGVLPVLASLSSREPTERELNIAMDDSGNVLLQEQRLKIDGNNLRCCAQDENDIANELMDRYTTVIGSKYHSLSIYPDIVMKPYP